MLCCMTVLCMTTGTFAQRVTIVTSDDLKQGEPIDTTLFKVQYRMTIVEDTLATEKPPVAETMMLEVGKRHSLFYSYTEHVKDSVLLDDMVKGASRDEITKHAQQYGSGVITWRIYKNYPAGKVTTLDKLGMSKFRCEEKNEQPQWTLLTDTATILSYRCHKATCRFKGRTYEAWYTPEIPRSEGPWKLCGLPGLMLKAKDSRNNYVFECTGVEQCRNHPPLLLSGGTFESINRKALNKLYERYTKDPIGFITSTQPGVTVRVVDELGNATKSTQSLPYNPIELNSEAQ